MKKGATQMVYLIITLVLLMVGLIVGLSGIAFAGDRVEEHLTKYACRESLEWHVARKEQNFVASEYVIKPLLPSEACVPTQWSTKQFNGIDKARILQEVGTSIADAHYNTLEAQYHHIWGDAGRDSEFCNVLRVLDVWAVSDFPEGTEITEQEIFVYLRDTEMFDTLGAQGDTYIDYVQRPKDGGCSASVIIKTGIIAGSLEEPNLYGVYVQSPKSDSKCNSVIFAPYSPVLEEVRELACNVDADQANKEGALQ